MAISVADGFSYKGNKPLDARVKYSTVSEMAAVSAADLYDGCFAYVTGVKKYYVYDSSNTVDATLGKWREYQSAGGHVIVDGSGNVMAERSKLQIVGADVTDDSTNDKTIITVDASVYHPSGSIAFASLPALAAGVLGNTYNITDDFTTTADFVEGAGKDYPAGTNVGIVNVGTSANPTYKYDCFAGFVDLSDYQTILQVTALPTASVDELGNIYQFVGTTGTYTKGYFYECVSDGEATPTYSWQQVAVQGGGSGHTILDETATTMADRSKLQLKGGVVTDDSTNDKTVFEVAETISKTDFDLLSTAEKNNGKAYYIYDAQAVSNLTVMGNRFDKANIFTTTERMVGSFQGKPLYQKTFAKTMPTFSSGEGVLKITEAVSSDYDTMVEMFGVIQVGQNDYANIGGYSTNNTEDRMWFGTFDGVTCLGVISTVTNRSGKPVYVTIRYTKTSDGTVTIGTENDYSTDEMIIGTWIDGKPIYQRTIQYTPSSTITFGSNSTRVQIADLSTWDVDTVVHDESAMMNRYSASDLHYSALPFIEMWSGVSYTAIDVFEKKLNLIGAGRTVPTTCTICVTLQYTKTTD